LDPQALELGEEIGKTLADGFRVFDLTAREGQKNAQRHDDPVIVVALQDSVRTMESCGVDGYGIFLRKDFYTKGGKFLGHSGNAIAFFELQSVSAGEDRTILGGCNGEKDRAKIGTIGNVDGGSTLAQQREKVRIYTVTLKTIRG
jgi:hypothetical protein